MNVWTLPEPESKLSVIKAEICNCYLWPQSIQLFGHQHLRHRRESIRGGPGFGLPQPCAVDGAAALQTSPRNLLRRFKAEPFGSNLNMYVR